MIGALNEGKVKAPWIIDGYCNSEIFDAYVENVGMFKKAYASS
ncbi:hypothetical protein [Wolbachia pipientis]|nr:hypothetical protein [Wolbachia pipientis]